MAGSFPVRIAGEELVLLADRAAHWPAQSRLLIADLHLGKGDSFRSAGIALPSGGTRRDLQRLSTLIATTAVSEMVILGDVLHSSAHQRQWRREWEEWRSRHPSLRIAAVSGNHDRALDKAGLDIELLGASYDDPPFALRHNPEAHPTLHVCCGHLHPVMALPGIRSRWPAFWLRQRQTVLPAFSAFTGGSPPSWEAGDRFAVCVLDEIVLTS